MLFGNNSTLQKEVYQLKVDLDQMKAKALALEEENSEYKKTIAAFHMSTQKYDKQVEEIQSKYEKELKALNTKLQETEKSVNRKVNKALQSIGVSEFFSEIPVAIASTDKELYNKFISMPNGPDKQQFFSKNEASIKRAIGL